MHNFDFLDQICPKTALPVENKKREQHHWILHIRIRPATKFSLKLKILTFWTKFAKKGHFWSTTKNVNTATEFSIFQLVSVSGFTLKWQYWQFGPKTTFPIKNLPKNHISHQKQKKWTASLNFAHSN